MKPVCVICIDELESNTHVCATKCGHVFHFECLNEWLLTNQSCPQCRGFNARGPFSTRLYFTEETADHRDSRFKKLHDEIGTLRISLRDVSNF
jgi:hypothetical protein